MIRFVSLPAGFTFQEEVRYSKWIRHALQHEGKREGNLQFAFVSDKELLRINRTHLDHDTYTDIITFPTSDVADIISGDIYISIDRVKENAKLLAVGFEDELARVIIHGVLHLIGYDDHTHTEKELMREKENYCLSLLPEN